MSTIIYDIIFIVEFLAIIIIGIPFGILCICKFIIKIMLLQKSTGTVRVLNPVEASLYYVSGKSSYGPINLSELAILFRRGNITKKTLVWSDGFVDWVPLCQLKCYGNFQYFKVCRKLDLGFLILSSIWMFFIICMFSPCSTLLMLLIGELTLLSIYYRLRISKFHNETIFSDI